jgi:hypothetical protein
MTSIERALTQLEEAGRIDRHSWLVRHNVKRRDIRTFPGWYNFKRKLTYCCNREQYRFLCGAAEHKEPTFKQAMIERYQEYWPDPEKEPDHHGPTP